ncbi:venom phosphodiesterase 2-like [Octopus bimaculoides]|nr:venom phosphodiesterase 2-like [Octopus bimaculoides]
MLLKCSENLNISTKINCANRHVSLYNPSTLPHYFHYTHNQRIGNFILVTDAGWMVAQSSKTEGKKINYDLDNSRQAFFLASGPSFVNSTLTEPFDNIELYNMMADLLKIEPAPNNGTEGSLNAILLKNASFLQETPKQANYALCQWSNVTKTNICPQLLSNESQMYADTFNKHLPFGLPYLEEHSGKNCLQFSKSFVFAFDSELQMLKWVSSTMKKVRSTTKPPHPLFQSDISSTNCFKYNSNTSNITTGYLLPYVDDEHYMKTAVPMFEGFKNGIWKEIHNLINEYRIKYSLINAVAGPIFKNTTIGGDVDDASVATTRQISEGKKSTFSVPSHFYLILGKCQSDGDFQDCRNHTEIMSVILPHTQETANCKRPRKYIEEYRSRIRDVEILTGTEFLTNLSKSDSVRLRTFLPSKLWEGKRASSWMNQPFCEKIDTSQCKNMSNGPTLIFISLDGFRVSYLNKHVTPVISRLRECGVHSPYMKPVFPSKTFPNHFSMATGLYPETHGIIANRMYDIKHNESFKTSNAESKWWNAEPVRKNSYSKYYNNCCLTFFRYLDILQIIRLNIEFLFYLFFFFFHFKPHKINFAYIFTQLNNQYHPDNYEKYNPVKSFEDNMDKAVAWIKNGVRFVALYFEQPDESGHRRGPNSAKVVKALQTIDSVIGVLMDELFEERLENCIDIVIVADHGMTDISLERVIQLSNILNKTALKQVMSIGSLVRISTKYKMEFNKIEIFTNETKDKVSEKELLSDLKCQSPYMNVYAKRYLPKVLHYANNIRIEDVIILPEDKWSVVKDLSFYTDKGSHGYDNRYRNMRSLFLAYGPDFKQNLTIKPFENIELYNLFTDIFNVTGAPNNGTVGRLDSILNSPPIRNKQSLMDQYIKTPFNMSLVMLQQFLQDNDCPNSPVFGKMVKELFVLLNDSNNYTDFEGTKSFGLPASNTTALLLPHTSHVTVYDSGLKLPTFIATTLTKENKLKQKSSKDGSCFIPDPRLAGQSKYLPNCSQEAATMDNLTWMNLYPSDFITDDNKIILNLSSSCIPVPYKFVSDLWDEALNKISEWLNTYSEINMFSGPIFDYNFDGRADDQETIWKFSPETVPTHVFLVLTSYNHSESDLQNSAAYILPTDLGNHSYCRKPSWILQNHKARIRDVELLTNLEFFPDMTSEKAVISRTSL